MVLLSGAHHIATPPSPVVVKVSFYFLENNPSNGSKNKSVSFLVESCGRASTPPPSPKAPTPQSTTFFDAAPYATLNTFKIRYLT